MVARNSVLMRIMMAAVLLVLLVQPVLHADDDMNGVVSIVSSRGVIASTTCSLTIAPDGVATVSLSALCGSQLSVGIEASLQRISANGAVHTVATWKSPIKVGVSVLLEEVKLETSGYSYRVISEAKAYREGSVAEEAKLEWSKIVY